MQVFVSQVVALAAELAFWKVFWNSLTKLTYNLKVELLRAAWMQMAAQLLAVSLVIKERV